MAEDLSEEGIIGSELFNFMQSVVDQDEALKKKAIAKVKSVVVLTLKGKGGKTKSWLMDFKKDGTVKKIEGQAPKADLTLIMADTNFVKLVNNEVSSQKLFLSGKVKVKGNVMKAANLEPFLRSVDPRQPKAKL